MIDNPSISHYQPFYFQFPQSFVFKVEGEASIITEDGLFEYTGRKTSDETPYYIWKASDNSECCTENGYTCEAGDDVYAVVGGAKGSLLGTVVSMNDDRVVYNGGDAYSRSPSGDEALVGYAWKKGSVVLYTKNIEPKRKDFLYANAVEIDTAHAPAIDSRLYGFVAKSQPYPMLPNPKTPYGNNWLCENGEEEYVNAIYYEPISFSVSFFARAKGAAAPADLREAMALFFGDVKEGYFSIFDAYTSIGRKDVRYDGFEEDAFSTDNFPEQGDYIARIIFSLSFKCNAPTTFMKMTNNRIEEI